MDQVIRDVYLMQFSEVIGPLPDTIFKAWSRGAFYFADDRKSRLSDMLRDGEDGSFDLLYEENDFESQSEGSEDEEEDVGALRQDDLDLRQGAHTQSSEACSETPDTCSVSANAEDPLVKMARCHSLEERFHEHKPEDIDEAEERQITGFLRWILQLDAARRPTVNKILAHPWLHT